MSNQVELGQAKKAAPSSVASPISAVKSSGVALQASASKCTPISHALPVIMRYIQDHLVTMHHFIALCSVLLIYFNVPKIACPSFIE